jgi:hypothetical protein
MDVTPSKTRGGSRMAEHDHTFWDTVLWELRSTHQLELQDEKVPNPKPQTPKMRVGTDRQTCLNFRFHKPCANSQRVGPEHHQTLGSVCESAQKDPTPLKVSFPTLSETDL